MTRDMLDRAIRNLEQNAAELLAAERGIAASRVAVRVVPHAEENHEHLHVFVRVDGERADSEVEGHLLALLRLCRRPAEEPREP